MHRVGKMVGGGREKTCIFSFFSLKKNIMPHLSLSQVKMQSLYLAHPFHLVPAVCTYSVVAFSTPVIFLFFLFLKMLFDILSMTFFPFARESGRDRRQVAEQV